jgi:hypothetical protein
MLSFNFSRAKWSVIVPYAIGLVIAVFGVGGWWETSGLAAQYPELTKSLATLIAILMLFVRTHVPVQKEKK